MKWVSGFSFAKVKAGVEVVIPFKQYDSTITIELNHKMLDAISEIRQENKEKPANNIQQTKVKIQPCSNKECWHYSNKEGTTNCATLPISVIDACFDYEAEQ